MSTIKVLKISHSHNFFNRFLIPTHVKKSIYTYDKIHCRKYNASLMSVCCLDDFYTMSDDYVKRNNIEGESVINNLSIESDYFAHTIEPNNAQLLNQIDEIKKEWKTGKITIDLLS